ncbi:MAG: M64 family metallopeptidase [Planctomycetota bacterium]
MTLALLVLGASACLGFDSKFTGRTLRFDYHHTGTAKEEHIAVDRWRLEGDWPGSPTRLVDDTGFGKYLFEVVDPQSGAVLYSRGFCSIYGEWETTGEANEIWRSFHESQRFPEPKSPVRVVLKKRGADGAFHGFFSAEIDPASRFVDRSAITPRGKVLPLFEHGPPATKVDLLVLADGYAAGDEDEFRSDAQRLVGVLFDTEPFKTRKSDFNVRGLFLPAAEAGISNPRKGVWRDSPLGCSFNAFDVDRYVLTYANERLREAAAQAPYDALIVLFQERKYGGGGIYNLWATVAADTEVAPYVFVHEFGHSFAGLADEYYSSQVAYEEFNPRGVEPWEANVTALLDPAKLKWKDLVSLDTPLPTPWEKLRYDKIDLEYQTRRKELGARNAPEEESEALMREVKASTGPLLAGERFAGRIGAFEGAMYQGEGLYRPAADCIMFTRNPTSFCRVCARALERVIDSYAK